MQTSTPRAPRRAGFTIFAREGRATCRLPGPWHFSQPDVPFGDGLGLDVVVHRVAAVAQRAGGPLHVVGRIVSRPPIGAIGDQISAPALIGHVPLRGQRKVVVADLGEVALLPLAAIDEGDGVLREGDEPDRPC